MATQNSRLTVDEDGDVIKVGFVDRNILEEASIQQIGDEISQIIEANTAPKMLLDFTNVEHLSSAALGQLITTNKKLKAKRGQLRLANIDPQILEVFVITKLDRLFVIHDTVDEAMASFK